MRKMSYREAYLSALKYNLQSLIMSERSDIPFSKFTLRGYYKVAKFRAATYAFNMKSDDLTSIPVW